MTKTRTVGQTDLQEVAQLVIDGLNGRGFPAQKRMKEGFIYRQEVFVDVTHEHGLEHFCISLGHGENPVVYYRFKQIASRKKALDQAVEETVTAIATEVDQKRRWAERSRKIEQALPSLEEARLRILEQEQVHVSININYENPFLYDPAGFKCFEFMRLPSDPEKAIEAIRVLKEARKKLEKIALEATREVRKLEG